MSEPVNKWAVGWAFFASIILITAGFFQCLAGIAGVAEDEIYATTPEWTLELDVTTWGWIHLILGVLLILSGIGILVGNVLARSVGVLIAALSAMANFAFLPWYPIWAITIIAVDIAIIWALSAHGRDVVRGS